MTRANLPPDLLKALNEIDAEKDSGAGSPMDKIMRVLASKDPADVDNLLGTLQSLQAPAPDLATYDFSKVRVKRDSFWILQMMPMGFARACNEPVREEYFQGSKPVFALIIYDESSSFRVQNQADEPGLPSSTFVLNTIKSAIAAPLPPLKPSLPELFIVALKLSPHIPTLKPFLDSLPKPFAWRLETRAEAENVAEGVDAKNREGVAAGLRIGSAAKERGNACIKQRDRSGALDAYTEAINALEDGLAQKPERDEKREMKQMVAVCLSNRAAAWLLEGEGQDAKKALQDAERGSLYDENYGKAYYRQAKAHQLLGDTTKAREVLTMALRRPSLARDKALKDVLTQMESA